MFRERAPCAPRFFQLCPQGVDLKVKKDVIPEDKLKGLSGLLTNSDAGSFANHNLKKKDSNIVIS